ncbi:hypothetical protein K2V61_04155 [Staphylococcus simulans]|uniref:immunodominant staphylococcal antigen IsaB family protein n=1 Tax=Staphylococcus simulans TaxID=1286 RepID=UPI001E2E7E17|nr:hypothetical protein [Staphylococcus simulans]MCD8914762.1 hypothetical protein [Staphylococcus simulans]
MLRTSKLSIATLVISTLVLGTSATHVTTNNTDAQAAEQTQKWGHGEGGTGTLDANRKADTTQLSSVTPWYNYNGYTTYDASFTQDYNFVRALKYDNVTIDGYKVNPNAVNEFAYSKRVYDTSVQFNANNQVVQLTFFSKPNSVTKAVFKQAHQSNTILNEGKLGNGDGTYVKYATQAGSYTAFFDHNGYLNEITISS